MAKYHDHYEKVLWSNGATALSAEHMNNLENGVSDLITYKVEVESGKGLSTNDYTTAEKTKLSGIATGAEVNQNAFSNIKVGSTTVAADSKTDTLELVAGSNVTLTPDATNDKVTIASADTHYTTHLYAGTSSGNANAATTNGNTHLIVCDDTTARDRRKIAGTGATTVTSDSSGNITINSTDTTYSTATTSANGLMSSLDKTKLNGIAAGAQVNRSIYMVEFTLSANVTVSANSTALLQFQSNATGASSDYKAFSGMQIVDTNNAVPKVSTACFHVTNAGSILVNVVNLTSSSITISKANSKAYALCIV